MFLNFDGAVLVLSPLLGQFKDFVEDIFLNFIKLHSPAVHHHLGRLKGFLGMVLLKP